MAFIIDVGVKYKTPSIAQVRRDVKKLVEDSKINDTPLMVSMEVAAEVSNASKQELEKIAKEMEKTLNKYTEVIGKEFGNDLRNTIKDLQIQITDMNKSVLLMTESFKKLSSADFSSALNGLKKVQETGSKIDAGSKMGKDMENVALAVEKAVNKTKELGKEARNTGDRLRRAKKALGEYQSLQKDFDSEKLGKKYSKVEESVLKSTIVELNKEYESLLDKMTDVQIEIEDIIEKRNSLQKTAKTNSEKKEVDDLAKSIKSLAEEYKVLAKEKGKYAAQISAAEKSYGAKTLANVNIGTEKHVVDFYALKDIDEEAGIYESKIKATVNKIETYVELLESQHNRIKNISKKSTGANKETGGNEGTGVLYVTPFLDIKTFIQEIDKAISLAKEKMSDIDFRLKPNLKEIEKAAEKAQKEIDKKKIGLFIDIYPSFTNFEGEGLDSIITYLQSLLDSANNKLKIDVTPVLSGKVEGSLENVEIPVSSIQTSDKPDKKLEVEKKVSAAKKKQLEITKELDKLKDSIVISDRNIAENLRIMIRDQQLLKELEAEKALLSENKKNFTDEEQSYFKGLEKRIKAIKDSLKELEESNRKLSNVAKKQNASPESKARQKEINALKEQIKLLDTYEKLTRKKKLSDKEEKKLANTILKLNKEYRELTSELERTEEKINELTDAKETLQKKDNRTKKEIEDIANLTHNISTLNNEYEKIAAKRDEVSIQLYGQKKSELDDGSIFSDEALKKLKEQTEERVEILERYNSRIEQLNKAHSLRTQGLTQIKSEKQYDFKTSQLAENKKELEKLLRVPSKYTHIHEGVELTESVRTHLENKRIGQLQRHNKVLQKQIDEYRTRNKLADKFDNEDLVQSLSQTNYTDPKWTDKDFSAKISELRKINKSTATQLKKLIEESKDLEFEAQEKTKNQIQKEIVNLLKQKTTLEEEIHKLEEKGSVVNKKKLDSKNAELKLVNKALAQYAGKDKENPNFLENRTAAIYEYIVKQNKDLVESKEASIQLNNKFIEDLKKEKSIRKETLKLQKQQEEAERRKNYPTAEELDFDEKQVEKDYRKKIREVNANFKKEQAELKKTIEDSSSNIKSLTERKALLEQELAKLKEIGETQKDNSSNEVTNREKIQRLSVEINKELQKLAETNKRIKEIEGAPFEEEKNRQKELEVENANLLTVKKNLSKLRKEQKNEVDSYYKKAQDSLREYIKLEKEYLSLTDKKSDKGKELAKEMDRAATSVAKYYKAYEDNTWAKDQKRLALRGGSNIYDPQNKKTDPTPTEEKYIEVLERGNQLLLEREKNSTKSAEETKKSIAQKEQEISKINESIQANNRRIESAKKEQEILKENLDRSKESILTRKNIDLSTIEENRERLQLNKEEANLSYKNAQESLNRYIELKKEYLILGDKESQKAKEIAKQMDEAAISVAKYYKAYEDNTIVRERRKLSPHSKGGAIAYEFDRLEGTKKGYVETPFNEKEKEYIEILKQGNDLLEERNLINQKTASNEQKISDQKKHGAAIVEKVTKELEKQNLTEQKLQEAEGTKVKIDEQKQLSKEASKATKELEKQAETTKKQKLKSTSSSSATSLDSNQFKTLETSLKSLIGIQESIKNSVQQVVSSISEGIVIATNGVEEVGHSLETASKKIEKTAKDTKEVSQVVKEVSTEAKQAAEDTQILGEATNDLSLTYLNLGQGAEKELDSLRAQLRSALEEYKELQGAMDLTISNTRLKGKTRKDGTVETKDFIEISGAVRTAKNELVNFTAEYDRNRESGFKIAKLKKELSRDLAKETQEIRQAEKAMSNYNAAFLRRKDTQENFLKVNELINDSEKMGNLSPIQRNLVHSLATEYENLEKVMEAARKKSSTLTKEELNNIDTLISRVSKWQHEVSTKVFNRNIYDSEMFAKSYHESVRKISNDYRISLNKDTDLLSEKGLETLESYKLAYEDLIKLANRYDEQTTDFSKEQIKIMKNQIDRVRELNKELNKKSSRAYVEGKGFAVGRYDGDIRDAKQLKIALEEVAKAQAHSHLQIDKIQKDNTKLSYSYRDVDGMVVKATASYDMLTGTMYNQIRTEEEYQSLLSKTADSFKQKIKDIIRYMGAYKLLYGALNQIKSGINIVKDIDSAVTELKKTSEGTEQQYLNFTKISAKMAKEVGSTSKDIISSAADWSRLGYSLNESAELAKNTALYLNVSEITDVNTATEHMISTLKAFNIEAGKSITIVDKFNEVGNNFAISSEGIGKALERSSAALVAAGNNLDESIALVTAGNIVAQNPEQVGNAIKVLSLRIRGAAAELEEMGESVDDLADSTSKMRKEILALTGVDIMIDDSTFKSTYDILLEISKVWENLTDVSQAATLEKLAGKTRASVVAGLIQNMDTAQQVLETSQNSLGSALKENLTYLDSIEGRLKIFQATKQELWSNFIDTDVVKDVVDLGTKILELVDHVGVLNTAFIALGTSLSFKGKGFFDLNLTSDRKLVNLSKPLEKLGGLFEDFSHKKLQQNLKNDLKLFEMFNKGIEKGIDINVAWEDTLGKGSNAIKNQRREIIYNGMTMDQYRVVQEANIGATNRMTLGFKASTLAVKAFSLALNVAISIGVGLLIQALVKGIYNLINASEKIAEKAEEAAQAIKSLTEEFETNRDTVNELKDRYAELSQHIDKFNRNMGGLSTDEYEEFLDIANQLAEIFPTLVTGYDLNNNAILSLDGDLQTVIKSLDELLARERELANMEIVEKMPDVFKGVKQQVKKYEEDIDNLQKRIDRITFAEKTQVVSEMGIPLQISSDGSIHLQKAIRSTDLTQIYNLEKTLISLGIEYTKKTKEILDLKQGIKPVSYIDFDFNLPEDIEEQIKSEFSDLSYTISKEYADQVNRLKKEISTINTKKAKEFNKLDSSMQAWLETDFKYAELPDSLKDIAQVMVGAINYENFEIEQKKLEEHINNHILQPLYYAQPEVHEAFEQLYDMRDSLRTGEVSVEDFTKYVHDIFGELYADMSESEQKAFTKMFIYSFNKAGIEGSNLKEVIDNLVESWNQLIEVGKDYSEDNVWETYKKDIEDYKNSMSSIDKALSNIEELSPSDIVDLLEEFSELRDYGYTGSEGIDVLRTALERLGIRLYDNLPEALKSIKVFRDMYDGALNTSTGVLSLSEALSEMNSSGKFLEEVRKEFEELGYISTETLGQIASKSSDLEEAVARLNAGFVENEELIEELDKKYKADIENYRKANIEKIGLNEEFFKSVVDNSEEIKKLADSYDLDYKNWKNILDAKLEIYADFKKKQNALDILQGRATAGSYVSMYDAIEMSKLRKELADMEKLYDDILKGIGGNVDLKGKGYTSGSTDKGEPEWLKRYNKLKADLDHRLAMDKITEGQYYNELDKLTEEYLKKHKDTHLDLYRKNVEEIYKGRKKLNSDSIRALFDDLKFEFDMDIITEEEYYTRLEKLNDKYYKGVNEYLNEYRSNLIALHNWRTKQVEKEIELFNKYLKTLENVLNEIDHIGSFLEPDSIEQITLFQTGYAKAAERVMALNKEIKKLNKEYTKGAFTEEKYTERLEDLTSQLQSASSAMKSYSDSIISTMKSRLDKEREDLEKMQSEELDALEKSNKTIVENLEKQLKIRKEIVDERRKEIRLQKEEEDYSKKLSEHTDAITKLEDRITVLNKAIKSGDREAIAEKRDLEEQLAEEKKSLQETQRDREVDLAERALDEEYDLYEKMINDQLNSQKDLYEFDKKSMEKAYETKLNAIKNLYENEKQLIKEAADLTKSKFSEAFETINATMSKYGMSTSADLQNIYTATGSSIGGIPTLAKILGDGTNYGQDASGKSQLNQWLAKSGYNTITKKQMVEIAKALNLSGINSVADVQDTKEGRDNKNRILEALKKAKFEDGGMVLTRGLVKSIGEDAIALVKDREIILNEQDSITFENFVPVMKDFMKHIKSYSPDMSKIVNKSNALEVHFNLNGGTITPETMSLFENWRSNIINDLSDMFNRGMRKF